MQSSLAAARRSGDGTRRSVGFAPTIDEEPPAISLRRPSQHSNMSELSLTLDDVDLQELHRNRSSLEYSSSSEHSQLGQSSTKSSHIVSAFRRMSLFRFTTEPQPDYRTETTASYGRNSVVANRDRDTRRGTLPERRQTFFARPRNSAGTTRSSGVTSVTSDPDNDSSMGRKRCCCLSDARVDALRRTISHQAWWLMTTFFILVLLFLPPIQDMCFPKTADRAMDAIYTLVFVVLAADIVFRSIVDESYFAMMNRNLHTHAVFKCCIWNVGSFMFWFDTLALLTILLRIGYVPLGHGSLLVRVDLDEHGFPVSGTHSTPFNVNWKLMLTVGRVGLMARFIRTSFLVHLSARLQIGRYVSLRYWLRKLAGFAKCRRNGSDEQNQAKISAHVLGSSSVEKIADSGPNRKLSQNSTRSFTAKEELAPFSEEGSESSSQEATSKQMAIGGFLSSWFPSWSLRHGAHMKSPTESRLFGNDSKGSGSHVGAAMRELTGQRIATGALLALIMSVLCNWSEPDTTKVMTMLTLHGQTANAKFAGLSVDVAHSSVIPTLFNYTRANGTSTIFSATYELNNGNVDDLRQREVLKVDVYEKGSNTYTSGLFDNSQVTIDNAKVELVTEIFIMILWIMGVISFAGPVMTLVVQPIERMVKLLSMLMKDPLGYQSSPQYRKLKNEDDEIADETMWPKEVLKGMETNFLMSTILRIGSLMRVGFGTAGVEIIRNNLERDSLKDVLFLSKQGTTVSCIFLFCDIRQFTDATECLQEEVFVFTNKVAAVVHSICNYYGGSANKNIGDAFLVSWLLDEHPCEKEEEDEDEVASSLNVGDPRLYANSNQADKALLSVIKISMALHYDNYYVDDMNEAARNRLLSKLSKRKGPIVQMGLGLHAGKAVQGAIGSQRKLDATYISESVERAEFLESSTKQYGVPVLMSDAFYSLLDSVSRRRCRKIDQLLILTEDAEDLFDPHEVMESGEKMNIYTFDMDIDAIWRSPSTEDDTSTCNSDRELRGSFGDTHRRTSLKKLRSSGIRSSLSTRDFAGTMSKRSFNRRSSRDINILSSLSKSGGDPHRAMQAASEELAEKPQPERRLILPTGSCHYSEKDWLEPDIKMIRHDYVSNGIVFPKYQEGLNSFYAKDWQRAQQCFEFVLTQRDDGPSRYFLKTIAEHNGVPPKKFIGFNIVR